MCPLKQARAEEPALKGLYEADPFSGMTASRPRDRLCNVCSPRRDPGDRRENCGLGELFEAERLNEEQRQAMVLARARQGKQA